VGEVFHGSKPFQTVPSRGKNAVLHDVQHSELCDIRLEAYRTRLERETAQVQASNLQTRLDS
jgi:hypothetical protein